MNPVIMFRDTSFRVTISFAIIPNDGTNTAHIVLLKVTLANNSSTAFFKYSFVPILFRLFVLFRTQFYMTIGRGGMVERSDHRLALTLKPVCSTEYTQR